MGLRIYIFNVLKVFLHFKNEERRIMIMVWFFEVMCILAICSFSSLGEYYLLALKNISEALPQFCNVTIKWGMSHTGLTLKQKLIDRWSDGLMTDSIAPETGWQKDISGKLCANRHSSQHPPICQPASGW